MKDKGPSYRLSIKQDYILDAIDKYSNLLDQPDGKDLFVNKVVDLCSRSRDKIWIYPKSYGFEVREIHFVDSDYIQKLYKSYVKDIKKQSKEYGYPDYPMPFKDWYDKHIENGLIEYAAGKSWWWNSWEYTKALKRALDIFLKQIGAE